MPCTDPAQTRGQQYCSGTAFVSREYRFDAGRPTAEAAILAMVAFGKDLCEKSLHKQELAAPPAEQRRKERRALLILPLLALLPG